MRRFTSILLALTLCLASQAYAAYAYVGSASSTSGNTLTYTTTAGNLVVIRIFTSAGGGSPNSYVTGITGATFKGVFGAMNNTANVVANSNGYNDGVFYLENCPSITNPVVSFNGGTPGVSDLSITEYSGIATSSALIVASSAPNHQTNPGTGTAAVTTGNINVTSQPALLLGFFGSNLGGNNTLSGGTGFNQRQKFTDSSDSFVVEDKRVTSTGNVAATATDSIGTAALEGSFALAFAEASSGPPPSQFFLGASVLPSHRIILHASTWHPQ